MAQLFAYKARTYQGELLNGVVEADNESAAVRILRDKNVFVVDVRPAVAKGREISLGGLLQKKVSLKELSLFCRQFSVMIGGGLPVFQALNILAEQTENVRFRATLKKVIERVQGGMSLAETFRLFPDVFSPIFTSMVEAGEVSGTLEQVLERLAVHFEKEHEIRRKVRGALTYPAVVLVIAAVAVTVLVTFVIPRFAHILNNMNVPLPLPTRVSIRASLFLRQYWYLVFIILLSAVFGLRYVFGSTAGGKRIWDRFVLKLPVVGALVHKVIMARFARTLGTMSRSAVPILAALDVVKKTTGNVVIAQAVEETAEDVSKGGSIALLLEKSGVFPLMMTRMIAIGEQTGTLEELLEKVAVFYDRDVEAAVERLAPTIEPVLIVFVGIIVGSIILSIMVPLFSIYGGVQ